MKRQELTVLFVLLSVPVMLQAARVSVIRLPADSGSSDKTSSDAGDPPVNVQPEAGPVSRRETPQVLETARSNWQEDRADRSDFSRPAERTRSFQPVAAQSARVRVVRQPGTPVPGFHNEVVSNRAVVQHIERQQRVEVVPNRQYWHTVNGLRYAHYYGRGTHWYGFNSGARFYWTRYYGSRWWWCDPYYHRWAFWNEGYWWWPGPYGVLYVYVNDGYYPYEPGLVTAPRPEEVPEPPQDTQQPPAAPPSSAPASAASVEEGHIWTSPDNKRQVQLVGPNGEAFLYNNSSGTPVFMKFLAKDVEKVRYSGGTSGHPLRILVDFKDDRFSLYDAEGTALNESAAGKNN